MLCSLLATSLSGGVGNSRNQIGAHFERVYGSLQLNGFSTGLRLPASVLWTCFESTPISPPKIMAS